MAKCLTFENIRTLYRDIMDKVSQNVSLYPVLLKMTAPKQSVRHNITSIFENIDLRQTIRRVFRGSVFETPMGLSFSGV